MMMMDLNRLLALFFTVFLITRLLYRRRNKNSPPSPFSLPLIGHLHLLKQPLHKTLETLSLKHGPIFSLQFGCRSFLIISSPSAVEECFTKNDIVFANRPRSVATDHLSNNYSSFVLAPYGDFWRSLRKLTNNEIFSQKGLRKFTKLKEEEVYFVVRHVFEKVSNGQSQKVDLNYLFSLLVFNIMMRISTGKQWIGKEEISSTIVGKQRVKEIKEAFVPSLSFTNVCHFFPMLRWIGYKGLEKSLIRLHNKRYELIRGWIEETRRKNFTSRNSKVVLDYEEGVTLIERLLSLQESEPEFCTEDVIQSTVIVSNISFFF